MISPPLFQKSIVKDEPARTKPELNEYKLKKIPGYNKFFGEQSDEEKLTEAQKKSKKPWYNVWADDEEKIKEIQNPSKDRIAQEKERRGLYLTELAQKQAGYDVAKTKATVQPLLNSNKETRQQMGHQTKAVMQNINTVSSVVSSSNNVSNNSNNAGNAVPNNAGGRDYAARYSQRGYKNCCSRL